MKKRGILAFIIYLFFTLSSLALAIYSYVEIQKIPADDDSMAALSGALLIIFAMGVGIPFGIELIVKILHLITGFKLFGIICMLGDVLIFLYLVGSIFTTLPSISVILAELPYMLVFGLPMILAFFSNLRSLAD
jgi:hypothetical protein